MRLSLAIKRKIDFWVGWPLLFLANILAQIFWLFIKQEKDVTTRRILVMKFQGIGSLVIALPALTRLRADYPNSHIAFWGTKATANFAKQLKLFDEVFVLDDSLSPASLLELFSLLSMMWKNKFDWAIDLEVYSKLSSVLLTLTLSKNRAGFAVDSVEGRKGIHTHLVYFNRYQYLGRAYMQLFGLLSAAHGDVNIAASSGDRREVETPEKGTFILPDKPYFVVNPNCGALALERRWPLEKMVDLIRELKNLKPDWEIVLTGDGAFEKSECAKIAGVTGVKDLSGQLSIKDFWDLIGASELLVSADSGPLHFGLASPTRVVGLFGPTRPQTYFPFERPASVAIYKNIYCSPCVHHWEPPPCLGNNVCMKDIEVSEVLEACVKLLGQAKPGLEWMQEIAPQKSHNYYPGLVYTQLGKH